MLNYLDRLGISTTTGIGLILVVAFLIINIIGEILSFKGKVIPAFMRIISFYKAKKEKRIKQERLIQEMQELLKSFNEHYSNDNIQKRNSWMDWVNNQATNYDTSITTINQTLSEVKNALDKNTKMAEEVFVQNCRDRIIDFATKVNNENSPVSREEFNRIFKVHDQYEKFLVEHRRTNGEIDVNFEIIQEAYAAHVRNCSFIEDIRERSK